MPLDTNDCQVVWLNLLVIISTQGVCDKFFRTSTLHQLLACYYEVFTRLSRWSIHTPCRASLDLFLKKSSQKN